MKAIEVFDPAMCCSTGVCGPSVDPELARFAGDLAFISEHGGSVRRYNLSQEPMAFAQNALVAKALQDGGPECLPLVLVGGEVRAMGAYPGRDKLMHWVGLIAVTAAGSNAAAGEKTGGSVDQSVGKSASGCGCGPKGCA